MSLPCLTNGFTRGPRKAGASWSEPLFLRQSLVGAFPVTSELLTNRRVARPVNTNALVLSGLANFQVEGRRVPLPACELASIRLRAERLVSSPLI